MVKRALAFFQLDRHRLKLILQLIRQAAADPHGQVMMVRTTAGLFVQTNKKQFTDPMNARSVATWQGAMRELLQKGLLENVGSKGEVFSVTTEGYRAADDLKSSESPALTGE